jgi:hypothetical protein
MVSIYIDVEAAARVRAPRASISFTPVDAKRRTDLGLVGTPPRPRHCIAGLAGPRSGAELKASRDRRTKVDFESRGAGSGSRAHAGKKVIQC